jgi:hypothetical protein
MNAHEPEDLNRLLSDAVDDIEPSPGIEAIRSRISTSKESTMASSPRTWIFGVLGAAAATAAVITAIVVVGNDDPESSNDPGVTSDPTQTISESEDPTPTGSDDPTTEPTDGEPAPVYWVGETARGLGLYREWTPSTGDDLVLFAVTTAVDGTPVDPDYSSGWPEEAEVVAAAASTDTGEITVDLSGDIHDRPAGMSAEAAQIAIDQLVYTAQAAVGEGRLPVRLTLDGGISDQVLGVPTSEPLAEGELFQTLSLVNIDSPAHGAVVTGDTLEVSGVANSFEANVIVKLQRFEGTFVAFQQGVMAEGWMDEKLFPFSESFDISGLEPGQYVLSASTDDPSGGEEGFGADTDTKVITIE